MRIGVQAWAVGGVSLSVYWYERWRLGSAPSLSRFLCGVRGVEEREGEWTHLCPPGCVTTRGPSFEVLPVQPTAGFPDPRGKFIGRPVVLFFDGGLGEVQAALDAQLTDAPRILFRQREKFCLQFRRELSHLLVV